MSKKSNQSEQCPWESGALGLSEEHAEKVSVVDERAVDESLGLQMISIRLPKGLIDDLKFIAGREGLGYQPLIRRILQRFTTAEFKNMVHETFTSMAKACAEDREEIGSREEMESAHRIRKRA